MKHIYLLLVLILAAGCGEPKPAGLPRLTPVALTFTQDGVPCGEASVHLIPAGESPWAVGGSTSASGTVVFRTHGKYAGVPAGKYKITVTKNETEWKGEAPKENRGMYDPVPESIVYDAVDTKFADAETTPLELEVAEGKKVAQQFDLGKKIRVPIVKPKM
jgi:hypothetical protein